MELQAWPVLKPHRLDLIAYLPFGWLLEGMKDESRYKFLEAQDG
jgi:hypothetical protein